MTKFLNLIADGFISIADSYASRNEYKRPVRNGFQKDQEKLRGDVQRVGKNLTRTVTAYYGKQPNKSSSSKP
jgi:hypothetical protein